MLQTAANKCCVAGMLCMSLLGIASTAGNNPACAQSQQEFTDIRLIPTRLVNFEVVLGPIAVVAGKLPNRTATRSRGAGRRPRTSAISFSLCAARQTNFAVSRSRR